MPSKPEGGNAWAEMAPKRAMRRPAGAPRLRRPAARAPDPPELQLIDLSLVQLKDLGLICLPKAIYYGREVALVGKVIDVRLDGPNLYLDLEVRGTQDDALLHLLSGKPSRRMAVHVCDAACANVLSDETLVHGRSYSKVEGAPLAWHTNLVDVTPVENPEDELAALRREAEERKKGGDTIPKKEKKEKKEKKKDKKRKASTSDDGKKKGAKKKKKSKESSSEDEELEPGQKQLKPLYEGTGLDPSPKRRRKITNKAKRLVKNKKKKKKSSGGSDDSSGSGSDSSTSDGVEVGGLFESEKRMLAIWRRYPGSLAASAAAEARQHLVAAPGAVWNVDRKKISPVFTMYTRQVLTPMMAPDMAQEAITVAQALDYLLQGHVAATCVLGIICKRSTLVRLQAIRALPSGWDQHCRGGGSPTSSTPSKGRREVEAYNLEAMMGAGSPKVLARTKMEKTGKVAEKPRQMMVVAKVVIVEKRIRRRDGRKKTKHEE